MKTTIIYLLVSFTVVITACGKENYIEIPYNPDFVNLVESDTVNEVKLVHDGAGVNWIHGKVKSSEAPGTPEEFKVRITKLDETLSFFDKNHVIYRAALPHKRGIHFTPIILPALIVLFWIVVLIFVLRLCLRLVKAVEKIANSMDK